MIADLHSEFIIPNSLLRMVLTQWQQEQRPRIERELTRVVEALGKLGARRIVLFGSHARGDFNEASDIDLMVILDTKERMVERIERVLEAIDSELAVEPLVYTPEEYERLKASQGPFIQTVEREGKVLYERSP